MSYRIAAIVAAVAIVAGILLAAIQRVLVLQSGKRLQSRLIDVRTSLPRRDSQYSRYLTYYFPDFFPKTVSAASLSEQDVSDLRNIKKVDALHLGTPRGCGEERGSPADWSVIDLSCLSSVERVHLYGNEAIPDMLRSLVNSPRLSSIHIESDCTKEMAEVLSEMRCLKYLHIGGAASKDAIEKIALCKSLRLLTFASIKLRPGDLVPLSQLKQLESLSGLNGTLGLEDLRAIGQFQLLSELDLSDCTIPVGGLELLSQCDTIQSISIANCTLAKGDIAFIGSRSCLTELKITKCQLEPGGIQELAKLPNVQLIELEEITLDKMEFESVIKCKSIETITLIDCVIRSGSSVDVIPPISLRNLNLIRTKIDCSDLQVLSLIEGLEVHVEE